MGPEAATPEILDGLAGALRRLDESRSQWVKWVKMSSVVVEALTGLGPTAATPEILASIADSLRCGGPWDAEEFKKIVEVFGTEIATTEVLALVPEWLDEEEDRSPQNGLLCVGYLGAAAATPEILTKLAQLQRTGDWHTSREASDVLCKIMDGGARIFRASDGALFARWYSDLSTGASLP